MAVVRIPGIHHVTAIAGDPQRNVDFYTQVLGLRLVKRTVNFDDPDCYHLYFGDEGGAPGTVMTFFAWPAGRRGRPGVGQPAAIAFRVPAGSLDHWAERLRRAQVVPAETARRFGEDVLGFSDPDGLRVELVAAAGAGDGGDPAIRGFHGVTLAVRELAGSARLLTDAFGMAPAGEQGSRNRFVCATPDAPGAPGTAVDLLALPQGEPGRTAVGTVHHVAFRARSEQEQADWRERLAGLGFQVTEIRDRCYFRSIYFREPGGVLFEIATDGPGFTVDEPLGALGGALRLPPWLQARRTEIEARLPPVHVPG